MAAKAKKPGKLYIRKFLNKPPYHSTACVFIKLDGDTCSFKISDCDKMISLDFDVFSNRAAQENALYKADTLIDSLQKFRASLAGWFEYQDKKNERN